MHPAGTDAAGKCMAACQRSAIFVGSDGRSLADHHMSARGPAWDMVLVLATKMMSFEFISEDSTTIADEILVRFYQDLNGKSPHHRYLCTMVLAQERPEVTKDRNASAPNCVTQAYCSLDSSHSGRR
jgi:hypothetical protein